MTRANIIIATAIAAATISVLALFNRPEVEPHWPTRIEGFSFSPLHADDDPARGNLPSVQEIESDLKLLEGKARALRIYSMEASLGEIAPIADRYGFKITLGAWISGDRQKNEEEIERVIEVARAHRNVTRVIVGNEVLYRDELPLEDLLGYVERVRAALDVPVSTAEPWGIWMQYPELGKRVDYIAAHILPYWEGIHVDNAVEYVVSTVTTLKQTFPGVPILIAEVGWPSHGRSRRAAVASPSNEATFLRRFLERATLEKYDYYVMEAFDQPWKQENEGAVGAYWGVWDAERSPKFSFADPIVANPDWAVLATISILIAGTTFTFMVVPSRSLRRRGRSFLAVIAFAAATAAVWITYDYINQYLSLSAVLVGVLLFIGMGAVILVLLIEAHEWAEALWVTGRRRALTVADLPADQLPMVSIHVPAYNEPAAMMIETLDALAQLDYPCFEVIVIDNNTRDPAVWEPVQAHCARLGERFRFFHVAPLAGFKAGALNYALQQSAADAEIVAVIDSDYQVSRRWLRDLVPSFRDAKLGVIQAPQDYRDAGDNAFKAMCYSEYAGFFYTGMVTRNERNAIIQHGTMTLVRRHVLEEIGGWAEWCITEDAELGLRIFEQGYEALYVARSYGRGLMPDTYLDYKQQRNRWALGAIQIMRRHMRTLLGFSPSALTRGQRYHFLAGWLPWLADGLSLFFNVAALAWSLVMVLAPSHFEAPLIVFSLLPVALFVFKLAKLGFIYKKRIRASAVQTLAGAMAGLALSHAIGKAVIHGFFAERPSFFRTPKLAGKQPWRDALRVAREEIFLMSALWLCAVGVVATHGSESRDVMVWALVLLIQSLPYFVAAVVALVSAFPRLSAKRIGVRWIESEETPLPLQGPK